MDIQPLNLDFLLALGTVFLQAGVVVLIVVFWLHKKNRLPEALSDYVYYIKTWSLPVAFFLTLSASALTLYYSEVLGILPCGLCWLQRVFMYPQVVLLGLAWWREKRDVADYSIALSLFGGGIALYQHYLQMDGPEILPCPAVAEAGDCSIRTLFELGYITFPLMSFTVFAAIIILMLFARDSSSRIENSR